MRGTRKFCILHRSNPLGTSVLGAFLPDKQRETDDIHQKIRQERLYNHLFRALYATIAAHWYCPSTVLEHNYKAEIQGHFTLGADGKKIPNYSARSHYDDYLIGYFDSDTQTMQRDGRLGIKLLSLIHI